MKQILWFALLIFTPFKINAQITISEGSDMSIEGKVECQKIIGKGEDCFFVFQQSPKGRWRDVIIEKYSSKSLEKIFSVTTKVKEIQKSMNFPSYTYPEIFYGEGKVFIFFYSYDAEKKQIICFLQTVSSEGELSEVFEVASSDYVYLDPALIWAKQFFKIIFSPNNKYFSIIPMLNSKECEIYNSSDYKKLGKKIIPSQYEGRNIDINNYVVDNSGNMVFTVLAYTIEKEIFKQKKINGVGIGIIEFNSPTTKIIMFPFTKCKEILDYNIASLSNGDYLLYGITMNSERKKGGSFVDSAAYFSMEIDQNSLAPKYSVTQDFKEEIKKYFDKRSVVNQIDLMKIPTFENTQVVEMNGDLYIISQYTGRAKIYKPNAPPFLYRSNKHLLVSRLNKSGEVVWSKVLPKYHMDFGIYEYSQFPYRYAGRYNVCVTENRINFIFLEHPSNENLEFEQFSDKQLPVRSTGRGAESYNSDDMPSCVCVSVDESGNCVKQNLVKYDKAKPSYVNVGNCILIENKKVVTLLENRKAKTQKFATFNFQ